MWWLTAIGSYECGKLLRSRATVVLVGLVPSCHQAFVGVSWVQNFFSWVFRRFKLFSRGYFVGLNVFHVGVLCVQFFFTWVFRGSKVFSSRYFVGSKFPFVGNFVIFSFWAHEKNWHRNISQTSYSIPNRFWQLWILLVLERWFIY